jgi:hypothetical protein
MVKPLMAPDVTDRLETGLDQRPLHARCVGGEQIDVAVRPQPGIGVGRGRLGPLEQEQIPVAGGAHPLQDAGRCE